MLGVTLVGMTDFDLSERAARHLPRRAEFRKRIPHAVIALVGIGVIGYFVYHVIHGDRGLIAWQMLDRDVADAQAELASIQAERLAIERRVGLLRIQSLDLDMLDEWSRRILNYGAADEAVIFTKDEDARLLPGHAGPGRDPALGSEPGPAPDPERDPGRDSDSRVLGERR